jgi:hypothetical protein
MNLQKSILFRDDLKDECERLIKCQSLKNSTPSKVDISWIIGQIIFREKEGNWRHNRNET